MSATGTNGRARNRQMSKDRALLCLGAWFFTAATLLLGGLAVILRFV